MKHIIFKLCLAGIFSLLAGNVTLAETIDIGPYAQSLYTSRTDSPLASNTYGGQGNDVRYQFRIEHSTIFLAHHGGSKLKGTTMYLRYKDIGADNEEYQEIHVAHNSGEKETASVFLEELLYNKQNLTEELDSLQEEQAYMCLLLKRGEYELICEGRRVEEGNPFNGELHTRIHTLQAGYQIEYPIDLGTHTCSYTYQDKGRYNIGYSSKHYVYYKVQIGFPMQITVEAYSSQGLIIALLNEQEEELKLTAESRFEMSLSPGTYLIRTGVHASDIWQETYITLTSDLSGNCPKNPILLTPSETDGNLAYSEEFDTNNYTDDYQGCPTNDICIALQLTDSLLTRFIFRSEEFNKGIYLTQLDSTQQEVKRLFISKFQGENSRCLLTLPPGKHYFVCEGAEENGKFQIRINGTTPEREKKEYYTLTQSMNYIQTIIPRRQCTTTADSLYYLSKTVHQILYFDHLGRSAQEVSFKASPSKEDIIVHHEYDMMGRDAKHWLGATRYNEIAWENKYEIGNLTAGTYLSPENVATLTRQQHADIAPYSSSVYENSLGDRITENYGAGETWQKEGRSNKIRYALNIEADHCLRFEVKGERWNPQMHLTDFYATAQLDVTRNEDEDGHTRYTFTDHRGHSILVREIAERDTLDTYYVYDDYNNLCFVLPPAALTHSHTGNLPEISQETLDMYAYQYRYDNRNRCIIKKLPGCEPKEMIYDTNNQLIFTQDGEQRKRNEWNITLSDLTGRQAVSGIYRGTPDRKKCEIENIYAVFDPTAENHLHGYKLNLPEHISVAQLEILKADYYDSYSYQECLPEFENALQYVPDGKYGQRHMDKFHCKLLPTGSIVFTLEGNTETISCYYYDFYRNLIQTRSITHTGMLTVNKAKYNFSGEPVKVKEEYGDSISLQKEMAYDHVGRLTAETHIVNDKDTVRFSYGYDKFGKMKNLTRYTNNGKPINTRYEYNIRDWVTSIDSPVFSQKIHYTDGVGTPCYNGNISSMTWQTDTESPERGYLFDYDALSRLRNAEYGEEEELARNPNQYDEQVTGYDQMGNIKGIKRFGRTTGKEYGLIDNLSMTYNGNRLTKVMVHATKSASDNGMELADSASLAVEYEYDDNGNLVKDLNRKIRRIEYNILNLPRRIEFENGNRISYLYDANGTKLQTVHVAENNATVTDYCDNVIYENGIPATLLTQYGYISLNNGKYHFLIQDHQGNNRVVVDQNGTVEEGNDYYPFGCLMDSSTDAVQPYKYNGKELDRKNGLNWYDYGARMYDPSLGRFTCPDPLAEAWAHVNPYNYCFNNPVNRTDPTGMASVYNWDKERYEDGNGNEVSWESVKEEYEIEDKDNGNVSEQQEKDRLSPVPPEVNATLSPWGNAASLHAGLRYTEHPFGKGYFRTKKGIYYPMDIFKQPAGTKLARKAKGMVNSAQAAKNATKFLRRLGNVVGGITTAISVYNLGVDTNIRDVIDVAAGIASFSYWEIGLLYLYGSVSYDTIIMNSQQMQENLQNGVNPMRGTFNFQTGRYEF